MTLLIHPSRLTVLALADLLAFLMFPVLGSVSHGFGVISIDTLLRTTLPMAVAWYGVSPLFGTFTEAATRSVGHAVGRALRAWIFACPVALIFRILVLDRPFDAAFILVSISVTGALLLTHRTALVLLSRTAR